MQAIGAGPGAEGAACAYQSGSHQEHGPVTRPLGAAGVVNNHQGCQMAALTAGRLKLIERNKDVA